MDITKINRKIFEELSEAEKSRILRFISEHDNFKLSSTISRYIETNPNFVKIFFSELMGTKDNWALSIITSIIYNFFDKIIELLGENLIYEVAKVSNYSCDQHSDAMVSLFINNYDKFNLELKEKLIYELCNNDKTLNSLTYKLTRNLRDESYPTYYKFSLNIRDFVLLKTVKKSALLLNTLYEALNKEIKEKSLNILIENNELDLQIEYLIEFITNNFSKLPENKKQFFLNKLFENANNERNDVFNEFDKLFKNLPYENFIELLKIFINKEKILSIEQANHFKSFINKIPENMRLKILFNEIPSKYDMEYYINKYGKPYPIHTRRETLAKLFSGLSENNFNESIQYLLDKNVEIEFFIDVLSENILKFKSETRNKLFEMILKNEKELYLNSYKIIKKLHCLPDIIDFCIEFIFNKKEHNWYKEYIISHFPKFSEEVKTKLLETKSTTKIAYIALSENFNLLSIKEKELLFEKLKDKNVPNFIISFFIQNYNKISDDIRLNILEELIKVERTKEYVARIVFENFYSLNKDFFSYIIENLILSEDKKVNFYLSKIINNFYDKMSTKLREEILTKIVKTPKNIDVFFSLVEEKILKEDDIINILSNSRLSRNVIKKLSRKFFNNIDALSDKSIEYLLFLASDFSYSKYLVWDFIHSFYKVPEILRDKILNIFIKTKNPSTFESFILAILDSENQSNFKSFLVKKISEMENACAMLARVLSRNFSKLDELIKLEILNKISTDSKSGKSLFEFLITNKKVTDEIKSEFLLKTIKVLDNLKNNNYISICSIARSIKKNFNSIPQNIINEIVLILFNNYNSRKYAVNIIIQNSKKLSIETNMLILKPIKENDYMLKKLEQNISINIKTEIIKKVVNYEEKYSNYFIKNSSTEIFKHIVRINKNIYEFKNSLELFHNKEFIKNISSNVNEYIRDFYYEKAIDNLLLTSITSSSFNTLTNDVFNSINLIDSELKSFPFKIFSNIKPINIIATRLRLDFYKFPEEIRNELLLLLTNYEYEDYVSYFVAGAVKYNIDNIPKNITNQVIKKLNKSND